MGVSRRKDSRSDMNSMKAILCADQAWGIGRDNKLLFSLPTDMQFFRRTTKGGVVVMGKKTLCSFPGGMPLKNRINIVLSSSLERTDCTVVRSLDELKKALQKYPDLPVWVLGGGAIYRLLLPYCEEILVTRVEADGGADTFFPDLDRDGRFLLETKGAPQEENGYTFRFDVYRNLQCKTL